MQRRNLKVEEYFVKRRYSEINTSQIRLKGFWLQEAGFKPGDRVEVECNQGTLTIKKASAA